MLHPMTSTDTDSAHTCVLINYQLCQYPHLCVCDYAQIYGEMVQIDITQCSMNKIQQNILIIPPKFYIEDKRYKSQNQRKK